MVVVHLNEVDGYWYVRRTLPGGGKETVARLGRHDEAPAIYRPQLLNDKAENLLSRLPENSVDLVITDPPYGIEYVGKQDRFEEKGHIMNDSTTEFLNGIPEALNRVLAEDSHVYVFTRWDAFRPMARYFEDVFDLNTVIVWDKEVHTMGDLSTWAPRHEWIMHFEKGSPGIYGGRPKNVLRYKLPRFTEGGPHIHPTQKPRALMEHLIEKSSRHGEIVLDLYGGSYAVPRAAQRLFRRSVASELDPELHRAAKSLVHKELHQDPEYGHDWTKINGLKLEDTDIATDLLAA